MEQQRISVGLDHAHSGGHTHSLLEFSTLHGLPHCDCEHLRGIIKAIPIYVKKMPATEKGLFCLILRHVWEPISHERINELFAFRKAKQKAEKDNKEKAVLDHNFALCDQIMTPGDVDEIHKIILRPSRDWRKPSMNWRAPRPSCPWLHDPTKWM